MKKFRQYAHGTDNIERPGYWSISAITREQQFERCNRNPRGCVWLPEHLTGEPGHKLLCNTISSRIIHEGWDMLEMCDWPDDLLEFVGIIVFAGG